jgi:hypothetical protein
MAKNKRKHSPKTILKLPDLEQSKSAVLNSLTPQGTPAIRPMKTAVWCRIDLDNQTRRCGWVEPQAFWP